MKTIVILLIALLSGFASRGQNHAANVQAIEKQVDAMVTTWNNHNYADIKNYTTADCDWVNIVGTWWKGRKEVQFAHQAFHDKMFKNTPMTKKSITVRMVSSDVAIVHFVSHVGKFITPSGHPMPEADDLATLVYIKQNGKWLLTAGHNVVIDSMAQKSNPVNFMPR